LTNLQNNNSFGTVGESLLQACSSVPAGSLGCESAFNILKDGVILLGLPIHFVNLFLG